VGMGCVLMVARDVWVPQSLLLLFFALSTVLYLVFALVAAGRLRGGKAALFSSLILSTFLFNATTPLGIEVSQWPRGRMHVTQGGSHLTAYVLCVVLLVDSWSWR
jgi:hypothetical protein